MSHLPDKSLLKIQLASQLELNEQRIIPSTTTKARIYTDGAYKSEGKYQGSAWGAVLRTYRTHAVCSGLCPKETNSSEMAELWAIWYGLKALCTSMDTSRIKYLIFRSDSQIVCTWLGWKSDTVWIEEPSIPALELLIRIMETAEANSMRLQVLWVDSKRSNARQPSIWNRLADQLARKARETHKEKLHIQRREDDLRKRPIHILG
jgi:ribonuclease HI